MKANTSKQQNSRAQRAFTLIATSLASVVLGIMLISAYSDLHATHLMLKQTESRGLYLSN